MKKVILVTDGDMVAKKAVEHAAQKIGGRCISLSAGNPTPLKGEEIVELILQTPYDPVVAMFDDKGKKHKGLGERAMEIVAKDPRIQVIGAIAVASHTNHVEGVPVDFSVTRAGQIVKRAVNKEGEVLDDNCLTGDTVDVLRELSLPVVVGIGDIGKMEHADDLKGGAYVTTKALEAIIAYHSGTLQVDGD